MTFEEILPALKQGKKAFNKKFSDNVWYVVKQEDSEEFVLFVDDGLGKLPIAGLRVDLILSDKWELVEENTNEK